MSFALVFVYGTLKRGFCRHHYLESQQFLGEATTQPLYRMVDCGDYPGLLPADRESGRTIQGELWQVDATCLKILDEVEGVAMGLYARRTIHLQPPFDQRQVQAYIYLRDASRMSDAGGDWRSG